MSELTDILMQDMKDRGADPFSMAYELTKIYAGSPKGKAKEIPGLFLVLYEMFVTAQLGTGESLQEECTKKDKKKKDKKHKGKDESEPMVIAATSGGEDDDDDDDE